ncbi:hypothetical protein R0131_11455 [Clostridium sp. AL.422]|uniref:hypothetical protein n=1 Tax=Clostridium TaxID=1485 RepID=UPI00293DA671|nr:MULTISPECIES: hypothetical protein [unclassified Clostridium]MDV4151458.1 hypothetical protein [Clostridium sp. AL.422]
MRNIINLLKYNFGKYHTRKSLILYIVGLVILLFNSIGIITKVPIISQIMSFVNVGFIVTFLSINFIWSIFKFQSQISKEKGKLLFTFPVKSSEFIIAKIMEFIILQGIIVFVASLSSLFTKGDFMNLTNISSIAVMFGTTVAYIIIISYTIICSSYINNKALRIFAIIIGGGTIQLIVQGIIKIVTWFLPYIYMEVGSFIEIDVISLLLNFAWIAFITWLAIDYLDKKLDII